MKELVIVIFVHLLAVMSPGPDFAIILRNSVVFSRKIGIYTAIGLAMGILVHVAYSLVGIGLLIAKSILLFNVIKIAGALYLIYLGIGMLFSKSSTAKHERFQKSKKGISKIQAIKIDFFTNVLNPKATLFFLSLFSQVISPSTNLAIKIIYGIEMSVATFLWFAFVASFFTFQPIKNKFDQFAGHIEKTMGAILTALGLKIMFFSKN